MPLANKTQMMLMNILMMTFAFSTKDEEDEDYEPRVEVRRIVTNIPKFPDISAFGPKSIGALELLNDWIDDDVGEWLVTHEKGEFLDEDSGIPMTPLDQDDVKVKSEAGADGAGESDVDEAGEEGKGLMSPAAKSTVSYFTKKGKRMKPSIDTVNTSAKCRINIRHTYLGKRSDIHNKNTKYGDPSNQVE